MVRKNKIHLFIVFSLLMGMMFTGCSKPSNPKETQALFTKFLDNEVKETLQSNYMFIQGFITHPENYGVDRSKVKVEIMPEWEDNYDELRKELDKKTDTFEDINRNDLNSSQKETYDIVEDQLDLAKASLEESLCYFANYFSPMNGLQSNVLTSLSDFVFKEEQDVEDMETLIYSVEPVFKSYLKYAKKQSELGLFMSNESVDKTVEYCDKVTTQEMGETMLATIKANLDSFDGVDVATKEIYKQRYEDAYRRAFVPAYENLKTQLIKLKDKKNNNQGLVNLENGKEAYELMYREYTGSTYSIEGAIELLDKQLDDSFKGMRDAMLNDLKGTASLLEGDGTLFSGYDSYESMLDALSIWAKDHYPEISIPAYEIVNSNLISEGIAAYYSIPVLDGESVNLMRVNAKDEAKIKNIETLYYVAHEGIPGHMYFFNYLLQNNTPMYRILIPNYLGFVEGFANYSAGYALETSKLSKSLKDVMRYNFDINWVITSRLDIGIHYEGWDLKKAQTYFKKYGLSKIVSEDLYNTIQSAPGIYLSYGIGYFEILTLREKAETELQDKFDEIKFNEALLSSGVAPFKMIEEKIDQYIEETK